MTFSVHILTPGFTSPNGRAFLYPLIRFSRAIRDAQISIRLYNTLAPDITDCDTLIFDSKYFREAWGAEKQRTIDYFSDIRDRTDRFFLFDLGDSSGWLIADALPVVDRYFKAQLLRDRSAYTRPMYGHRPYADFAYRNFGISDSAPVGREPQVKDASLLSKLGVSWNSGLADYSLYGPMRMALYQKLPLRSLLRQPASWVSTQVGRTKAISCRMGISYDRPTVRWQREQIRLRLQTHVDTQKLSRAAYLAELANSRIAISPFGLGEITLKDFEVFLSGSTLLKPDMSHLDTWPDLFQAGRTMLAHRWDLNDLDERIQELLNSPDKAAELAVRGQECYRHHIAGADSAAIFTSRFASIVRMDPA